MKIRRLLLFAVSCLLVTSMIHSQPPTKWVTLKGKLVHFGNNAELELLSEFQYLVPKTFNPVIAIKPDSTFTLHMPLQAPGYFRLGRNKLYLTPGDNMEVYIDRAGSELSVFKGKGSEINNFLRKVPFPKGGSFLDGTKEIKSTADSTLNNIRQIAAGYLKRLNELKTAIPQFVALEKARVRADFINSIVGVNTYARIKFYGQPKEQIDAFFERFNTIANPVKDSLLKDFVNAKYLQIETYRQISTMLNLKTSKRLTDASIIADWQKANHLAFMKIKAINSKAELPALKLEADSIKTKSYRDALNTLINEKMKFGTGDTAIDLTVRNTDGTTTTLSSLKGKVIYIDIWATWCGPCMAEMPNFEKLKEKFSSNPNVKLVSLSVDDNDRVWLNDLKERNPAGIQWRIDRAKLSNYEVETVPRYILIDKNFIIAEMNAARAADPELAIAIQKLADAK